MQSCCLNGFLTPTSPLPLQHPRTLRACLRSRSAVLPPVASDSTTFPSSSSPASPKSTQRGHGVSWSERRAAIDAIQSSDDLVSALSRFGGKLQVQDLNTILRFLRKTQKWERIIQVFSWMEQRGNVTSASYSTFFKFMGEHNNVVKALEVYNAIGDECMRYNVTVCNAVLGCLVRNGRLDTGMSLFEKMKKGGLTPDIVTYSILLSGCKKVRDGYSKSLKLLQEISVNNLQMDDVMYGSVLAVCASNNLSKEAEAFFQQMVNEGYAPNVFHYSSMLNAYSADGDYAKAENLVKNMQSAGIEPNKVILTTLLKVYVKGGLFEKSRELLEKLGSLGHAENEIPYCILMDGLVKTGKIDEAKVVFEEMKTKSVKSEGYAHSIIISACCRHGLIEEANKLAKEYEDNKYKHDLVMMNTLLRTYCQSGEMEDVMKILKKMDEMTISPDWNTFQILIKYFYKKKMYTLAFRSVEDMHSKGYQLDEKVFSLAISRYIVEPEKKELLLHLLRWMTGQGYCIDSSTRNHLLKNSHLFGQRLLADVLSEQFSMSRKLQTQKV